jgi:hypothetical protein
MLLTLDSQYSTPRRERTPSIAVLVSKVPTLVEASSGVKTKYGLGLIMTGWKCLRSNPRTNENPPHPEPRTTRRVLPSEQLALQRENYTDEMYLLGGHQALE